MMATVARVAAFEFRYQAGGPLYAAAALLFFAAGFVDMAVKKVVTNGGGNVLYNSPHALIVAHLMASLLFLFVGAAFVANSIVRDDQSGFGAIMRTTPISKAQYLYGRFAGAFAAGVVLMALMTLGEWVGSLMPFADAAMIGPNRPSGFAIAFFVFALPNALIISAILFAAATITRSTAGTYLALLGLLMLYLLAQTLVSGQPSAAPVRALSDPFAISSYLGIARYSTAAEFNAGHVPIGGMLIASRLLWIGIAIAILALTHRLFRPERTRRIRRRASRVDAPAQATASVLGLSALPSPRFDAQAHWAMFVARAAMEARLVILSPAFLVLMAMTMAFTLIGLFFDSDQYGVTYHPVTATIVPFIRANFSVLLLVVATFYGGELVWRDRETKVAEIIDAAPVPPAALMVPKLVGLMIVMGATLVAGMACGLLVQLVDGAVDYGLDQYVRWYLVPGLADALVAAVLAIGVAALSPNKFTAWGIMALYILLRLLGPGLGIERPWLIYGHVPEAPLSDMSGLADFWKSSWSIRAFWLLVAALFLLALQALWPRGTANALRTRIAKARLRTGRGSIAAGVACLAALLALGTWLAVNAGAWRTAGNEEAYRAAYEKRYLAFAKLPQPSVEHIDLDVDLHPRANVVRARGHYRIANRTGGTIDRVHVRLSDRDLELVRLHFPGARIERDDAAFRYRIYRLDRPMMPGETRRIAFATSRPAPRLRRPDGDTAIVPNGTDIDSTRLVPRIGMSPFALVEDRDVRRKYGLPAEFDRVGRLDDPAAPLARHDALDWTTTDIRVTTDADQVPVAPGTKVSDRMEGDRRTVRFVSSQPVRNGFAIQSARYAVAASDHRGVHLEVYHHPTHRWNVARVQRAMRAAHDYYATAFGPYQFDQFRVVESPYRGGAHAYAGTIPFGEFFLTSAVDKPGATDIVTFATAHEFAHQWWGHQVVGARMQGAGMLIETLAQYSALMVLRRLNGEASVRDYLVHQRDRYLSGRRASVAPELPLVAVEPGQDHIAYGKGALAMYLLQERMGEAAVNRALRAFVDRYRFSRAPYPRSTDLVALLRVEATTREQQQLITDLFERITLFDLKVGESRAVRRHDGTWLVSVPVSARKLYADRQGRERAVDFADRIEIGLFAEDGAVPVKVERLAIRSGTQTVQIVSPTRPNAVAIDPYSFYLDRNSGDNRAEVE